MLNTHPHNPAGKYVLYWMHHAVRAYENPALDIAVWSGNELGLPVLVYQGLSGRHRYNSDRHHTFIMEGARHVQQALIDRGIAYAFHLDIIPDEAGPLRALCADAAQIITEDFPAPPFPRWLDKLSQSSSVNFWAVDTHCITPMMVVGKSYDRAFKFREATKQHFEARISREWTDINPIVAPFKGKLPFESVDFSQASIPDLCAACDIDHSIGPVPHTTGGSKAGYERWEAFKAYGLASYARTRNDATIRPPKGVSRLSPYLHHGHVSPFRIAREAAATGSAGANKFLDELLIWRELAFNFCFHHHNVESLSILPGWARHTLSQHTRDQRDALMSWQQLAHGETGDELWDAAQKSLLIHGELHNNVRMTWGKAFLKWTPDSETALKMMIDLNHRYALDGSDPNSYAGLVWCLGLFDRPFKPEIPIYGSVRPRPTEGHANRIDMSDYTAYVNRPARAENLSVAIIGAGFSGLTAGNILKNHGLKVQLFDKSRGPGGRMATRRTEGLAFDHGAQYFTARDDRFKRYVDSWVQQGLVAPWSGKIGTASQGIFTPKESPTTWYVGVPRMSALTRHLSQHLTIQYQTRIARIAREDSQWQLFDEEEADLGSYDVVLITTPPDQTLPLLPASTTLPDKIGQVKMKPCWAGLVAFDKPVDINFDGLFVHNSALAWIARNSSKPGRDVQETWVIHGSPAWSQENLESDKTSIAPQLLAAFFEATGVAPVEPVYLQAHRWRYALAENPLSDGCLWDGALQIGVCGDWCANSRVEGAFLSGAAIAGRVLGIPDNGPRSTTGIQASLF